MASKKVQDCLPPGWKLLTKVITGRKYKYYINLKTHKKFYSKLAMLRHVKDGGVSTNKFQHINKHAKKTSGNKQIQLVEANDYEWLPTGWVVERRTRKSGPKAGEGYKCFIDPSTGSKFFSKPEVLRYLGSKHCSAGLSKGKDKETSRFFHSEHVKTGGIITEKVPHINEHTKKTSGLKQMQLVQANGYEWLPTGWVVERRIRQSGTKAGTEYKCYIDSSSGSKFFSKPEVLRYLGSKQLRAGLSRGKNKETSGHSPNEIISSNRKEDPAKSRTSKQLFSGEESSRQIIEAPLKDIVQEKSGGKKNRTSFRLQPAPASIPKKTNLSPESVSDSQEKVEAKKPLGVTKHTPAAVEDVDAKDASCTEPTSVSSRDKFPKENPLAVDDCNDRKVQTTKRKINDGNSPCTPLRSSKRLAGVGVEVVFLPIPIEHVLRAKPSGCRPIPGIPSLGSVPDEKLEKQQDVDRKDLNEGARKATSVRKSSTTKPFPTLESVPKELLENCTDVDTKILNEGVFKATGRRKSFRSKLIPCSKSSPDGLYEMQQDVDEQIVLSTQRESSLMGMNDINLHEENHRIIDGDKKIGLGVQVEQPLNKIDGKLCSLEVECQGLEEDSEIVLASHGESFYKIDVLQSQLKHYTLNVDTNTVLTTQGEPSNKIDYLTTKRPILVDLNDLQLEAPPGFSGNTKVGASTITMKQPLECPMGNSLGSKGENNSRERSTSEEQSGEQLASTKKQTEQPQSDLFFTAPLWSDPCLDFAYKTLTGAIPFDDNLAIQDYIQHQLRTSEQSSDM